jgi:hypothetical protein
VIQGKSRLKPELQRLVSDRAKDSLTISREKELCMRAYLPIAVAIVAFWGAVQATPAFGQVPYEIQLNLIVEEVPGKEHCVYRPCAMALEGQPASIDFGFPIQPPEDAVLQEPLRRGHYFLVTVFRKNGRIFVDATARLDATDQADVNAVRITTTGLRVVEAITMGQKITVPLPLGQKGRWELLVQKAEKKTGKKDESNVLAVPATATAVPTTGR